MTVRVTHPFVSAIPDGSDTDIVRPSDWNADHTIEGLGTAAEADTTDFATAAQGAKADTALQSSDIGVTVQQYDADLAAWAGVNPSSYSTTAQIAAAYQPLDADLTAWAAVNPSSYSTTAQIAAAYQPLDADLTSWALITRASGFDTFTATPSWTNFLTLVTGEPTFYTSGGTDVSVADGGTGRSTSTTAYGLIAAGTTATGAHQTLAAGATTAILVGGGASALPAWTTATGTGAPARAGSPAFTGTPTAPTAAVDTNTTQLATTAMVLAQAAAATPLGNAPTAVVGTSTRFARADHVHPGREVLTASRTYYVRTDGSDSNTGLVDTSGGAFLTPQKAFDVICTLDLAGYGATISVGTGSFEGITFDKGWVGGNIAVTGAGAANTTLTTSSRSGALYTTAALPGLVTASEFKITTSGGSRSGIRMDAAGKMSLATGIEFGSCTGRHMLVASPGAYIQTANNYTISGGATVHMDCQFVGFIRNDVKTVTLTGTPAFSSAFAAASNGGAILASALTFSGSATGARYSTASGGGINTGGGGASYFPGNSAGSATSPGWYV